MHFNLRKKTYYYNEAPFKVDSRSGHTAVKIQTTYNYNVLPALFIYGGRQNDPHQFIYQGNKPWDPVDKAMYDEDKATRAFLERIKKIAVPMDPAPRYKKCYLIHKYNGIRRYLIMMKI